MADPRLVREYNRLCYEYMIEAYSGGQGQYQSAQIREFGRMMDIIMEMGGQPFPDPDYLDYAKMMKIGNTLYNMKQKAESREAWVMPDEMVVI
jgi:hypothetical protein